MKWTKQTFEEQPTEFILDLIYLYRTQSIIQRLEQADAEQLLQALRARNNDHSGR